jgi:hypothetical protein
MHTLLFRIPHWLGVYLFGMQIDYWKATERPATLCEVRNYLFFYF